MSRKKLQTKTKLKKKLDTVFSKYIRARDGKCLRCGRTDTLQCAHIESRTHLATRWDEENAVTLCYKDHIHWAHKEPVAFTKWLYEKFGDVVDTVHIRSHEVRKYTKKDYEELIEYYSAKLNELQSQ